MKDNSAFASPSFVTCLCLLFLLSLPALVTAEPSGTQEVLPEATVHVRDVQRNGKVNLLGNLGLPVGTPVTLEGKRAKALKTTNAKTLLVESINGEEFKPESGYSPFIQIANVDALPEQEKLVVEGYEFVEWVGDPVRNWYLDASFVITKAITPKQLNLYEMRIRPAHGFQKLVAENGVGSYDIGKSTPAEILGEDTPDALRRFAGHTRQSNQQVDFDGLASQLTQIIRQTKDADVKWRAVRALGYLQYRGAMVEPLLIECLKDDHHYVRANAARALGDLRVAAASGPLLNLLESETDGGVIEQTSLALQNLHVGKAVPVLKKKVNHESIQTRIWVLQAIGDLGSRSDVPFLAKHLDAASQPEQEAAIRAIENLANVDFDLPQQQGPQDISKFRAALERSRNWWDESKATFAQE